MPQSKPSVQRASPLALLMSAAFLQAPVASAQGLEEVIVTAQKREASLQDTPISITTLNSEQIEKLGIQNITDVSNLASNVSFVKGSTIATGATIAIRGGVTINPAISLEATVGMYLDGVYIGKALGSIFDVADLERVEVLKGPQGTLYGRNTLGGAVNLVTKKPTGELGGKVGLTGGNEGLLRGKIDIDFPALELGTSRLAAKIAYQQVQRDGFYDNQSVPGFNPASPSQDSLTDLDSSSGRVSLLWEFGDAFSAHYSYDASRIDQAPTLFQITSVVTPGDPLQQFASTNRVETTSNDGPLSDVADVDGHGLTLTLNMSDALTLKSITGYREMTSFNELDLDGSPLPLTRIVRDTTHEQLSQELQLLGQWERTNIVAGAYYLDEDGFTNNPQFIDFSGDFDSRYGLEGDAWAVYGQFDWRPPASALQDRLTLTLGARYTREDKTVQRSLAIVGLPTQPAGPVQFFNTLPLPAPIPLIPEGTSFSDDFDNWTGTFIAAWDFNDDINAYIKYAQGWKSGGFNAESSDVARVAEPFSEEELDSFELGLKTRLADNRVQMNLAMFLNKHDDMQLSIFQATGANESIFVNAGAATVSGAELELTALASDNLRLELNWGYLDTEYDEFINGAGQDVADIAGFPYSPRNKWNAAIEYFMPGAGGELFARIDYFNTDTYVGFPENFEATRADAYSLIDVRAGVRGIRLGESSSLDVVAWVKNADDEDYTVNGIDFGLFAGNSFGDPRTYGLDIQYNF